MERLNIVEKINDMTTIVRSGLSTLHMIPKELLAYFRLISRVVNSLITNRYCLILSCFFSFFFFADIAFDLSRTFLSVCVIFFLATDFFDKSRLPPATGFFLSLVAILCFASYLIISDCHSFVKTKLILIKKNIISHVLLYKHHTKQLSSRAKLCLTSIIHHIN